MVQHTTHETDKIKVFKIVYERHYLFPRFYIFEILENLYFKGMKSTKSYIICIDYN